MKQLFCILGILLIAFTLAFSQNPNPEIKELPISNFSGGLNLWRSDLGLPTSQGVTVLNLDLSIRPPSMGKRPGYYAVTDTIDGDTTFMISLYGLRRRDGRQFILEMLENIDYPWTDLYQGNLAGSYRKGCWFYRSADIWYTTWKDKAFICDGYNRPWYTDGENTDTMAECYSEFSAPLHIQAPGEFFLEILDNQGDTSISELNGKYRWGLVQWPPCDTTGDLCSGSWATGDPHALCMTRHLAYLSDVVTIRFQQVMIHLWSQPVSDSLCTAPYDSMKFQLVRTRPGENAINPPDSLNEASPDSLYFVGQPFKVAVSDAESFYIIDSGWGDMDTAGGFAPYFQSRPDNFLLDRKAEIDSFYHAGAPRFFSMEYSNDSSAGGYTAIHRYYPICGDGDDPPWTYCPRGFNWYWVTYYDTILNVESDTSWHQTVYFGTTDSLITLLVPKVPDMLNHVVRRIYRVTLDGLLYSWQDGCGAGCEFPRYLTTMLNDDTIFVDTFSRAQLDSNPDIHVDFDPPYPTPRLAGMTVWHDRLYGWDRGPNLYYTAPDTPKFEALDYIALGPDDGEPITAVVGGRNRLYIYKPTSRHKVFEDANGNFSRESPPYYSGGVGCVSGKTMCQWRGSRIYLGIDNVYFEQGSPFYEAGDQLDTIGQQIKPVLDRFSRLQKESAVAALFESKYLLSFPGTDTTLVCFLDVPGRPWAIYDFSFLAATYYEDDADYELHTPENLIFCKRSSDLAYHYGDTTNNNGTGYFATYKSGKLLTGYGLKDIDGLLLFVDSADTQDGWFTIFWYDAADQLVDSTIITNLADRMTYYPLKFGHPSPAYQFEIVVDSLTDSLLIEAMYIYYHLWGYPKGE